MVMKPTDEYIVNNKKVSLRDGMDNTNPDYYKNKPIEIIKCIASICYGKEGYQAFLVGQVVKYVARYNEKNGLEDLNKAKWYLNDLIRENGGIIYDTKPISTISNGNSKQVDEKGIVTEWDIRT